MIGKGRLGAEDRQAFTESAMRSVEAAREMPGCVLYYHLVDLFDPETVFLIQAWESEQVFRAQFEADYHVAEVREIVAMDFAQVELFRFNVDSWEHGPGTDLRKRVEALDAGVRPGDLPFRRMTSAWPLMWSVIHNGFLIAPPSISTVWPVMKLNASEHRNNARSATSCIRPSRLIAWRSICQPCRSGGCSDMAASESTSVGATPLTRMRSSAYRFARSDGETVECKLGDALDTVDLVGRHRRLVEHGPSASLLQRVEARERAVKRADDIDVQHPAAQGQ
jgi:quinol monooxygenase YgiN